MPTWKSFKLRLKIVLVSLFTFLIPPACGCYMPPLPTPTSTPALTPTPFTSPLSPLPTPTPTPTPTPEARHMLLDRLLAEDCLPPDVVRQLEG